MEEKQDTILVRRELACVVQDIRKTCLLLADMGCRGWDQPPGKLEALRQELAGCQGCKLSHSRIFTVFGEGNPRAQVVFVGPGLGAARDAGARHFAGQAGGLLAKIIQAMGLDRESVYITCLVKCPVPPDRGPEPDEIAACLPYFNREVLAVSPQYICALGSVAAQALLNTDEPIEALRGKPASFYGIPLMPTFHPEQLLADPSKKREVWSDVQVIMRALGTLKSRG